MTHRKFLLFLLQAITAGLAAAFLYILLARPELLQHEPSVVEVREAAPLPAAAMSSSDSLSDSAKPVIPPPGINSRSSSP